MTIDFEILARTVSFPSPIVNFKLYSEVGIALSLITGATSVKFRASTAAKGALNLSCCRKSKRGGHPEKFSAFQLRLNYRHPTYPDQRQGL